MLSSHSSKSQVDPSKKTITKGPVRGEREVYPPRGEYGKMLLNRYSSKRPGGAKWTDRQKVGGREKRPYKKHNRVSQKKNDPEPETKLDLLTAGEEPKKGDALKGKVPKAYRKKGTGKELKGPPHQRELMKDSKKFQKNGERSQGLVEGNRVPRRSQGGLSKAHEV